MNFNEYEFDSLVNDKKAKLESFYLAKDRDMILKLELDLLSQKHNTNFLFLEICEQIMIGYWRVTCIICQEYFYV